MSAASTKRGATDVNMPPPPIAKSPRGPTATVEGAAGASEKSAGSAMILHTVDDIMAVLPQTSSGVGMPASASEELTSSIAGIQGGVALRSPSHPSAGANGAASGRLRPTLSSEPPLLDFGVNGVFESPALMPANALLHAVPAIDVFPVPMENADSFALPVNPFSRAALNAPKSQPVEGGILMLHDLQETEASRAALVSAWRDYGSQLLPQDGTAASGVTRRASSSLSRDDSDGEPSAIFKSSSGGGSERKGATSKGFGSRHSNSADGSGSGSSTSTGHSRGGGGNGASSGSTANKTSNSTGHSSTSSRRQSSGMSSMPDTMHGIFPGEGDGVVGEPGDGSGGGSTASGCGVSGRRLGDSRGGVELLDDAVSLLSGVSAAAAVGGSDAASALPADARVEGAVKVDLAAVAASGENPAAANEADEAGDNDADEAEDELGVGDAGDMTPEGLVADEAIRNAVRDEMANSGMTQNAVSQGASVSQPVLCTYLGSKASKANGKNSRGVVRMKLVSWLNKRGVATPPAALAVLGSVSSDSTADAALASNGAGTSAAAGRALTPDSAPGSPRGTATTPNGSIAGGAPSLHAAAGPTATPGASSGKLPVRQGSSGALADKAAEKSAGRGGKSAGSSKNESGGTGGGGKSSKGGGGGGRSHFKLTPQHLYVAYIWYLKQRDAEGVGLRLGEEESFCLKCKDGGDVLLCDYGGCTKAFHMRCCGLKTVPSGIWECPRHRCVKCGAGPSHTDAQGKPRKPDTGPASVVWSCRACPTTYCERCLPEEVSFAGDEILCETCQSLLCTDMSSLQRDLIKWKPEMFAASSKE